MQAPPLAEDLAENLGPLVHPELRVPEVGVRVHGPQYVFHAGVEQRSRRERELRLTVCPRQVQRSRQAQRVACHRVDREISTDVEMTARLAQDPYVHIVDAHLAALQLSL